MPIPSYQFTIRRSMLAVAVVALLCWAATRHAELLVVPALMIAACLLVIIGIGIMLSALIAIGEGLITLYESRRPPH